MFWRKGGRETPTKLQEEPVPEEETGSAGDDVGSENLLRALHDLKSENSSLKAALQAKGDHFIKCGYLFKYRPFASGLFDNPWERRFFVLRKGLIEYYRSEADTQFPPRGAVTLQSCFIELEPLKKRKYFTFSIIDDDEKALALRLSTELIADGERWVAALRLAGIERQVSTTDPQRELPPAMDIRRKGGTQVEEVEKEKVLPRSTSADLRRRGFWKLPIFSVRQSASVPEGGSSERASSPSSSTASSHPHTGSRNADSSQVGRLKRGPFTGSIPVHASPKYSILSSEEVQNQQHSGLINLVFVIIFSTHSRLIIENSLKYGVRFNPLYWIKALLESSVPWQVFACWPTVFLLTGCSYYVEVIAACSLASELKAISGRHKKAEATAEDSGSQPDGQTALLSPAIARAVVRNETAFGLVQIVVINTLLLLPCAVIVVYKAPPAAGILLLQAAVVLWMKLVSYAHCCNDLRSARRHNEVRPGERGNMEGFAGISDPQLYPENITRKNFVYFLVAPTLTYQVNYPRVKRFRKRWLLRRVLELTACLSVGAFIVEQYILPSCMNSLHPLHTMDIGHILERVLKLSLPSLYVWLIGFYSLFHLWLNILAELTYFGDREFYKDWWNATTVDEYWRKWNQPVHKWLMRTVYFPSHRIGLSKYGAVLLTFLISALFHELLVGVPLQMLRAWAFAGMMGQIPLIAVTNLLKRKLKSDIVGNIIFWISFCILGQPIAVLLYFHDYVQGR
mmetsp:Transcript_33702/g.95355  ORF Transcript_33702/g.95355 Transcript_33702/m.95355 type:complete len:739 (+) Transcript_33702:91-2307(+)